MAATTRARTGNSKPRVVQAIEDVVAPKKRSTSTTTKANTSKPRTVAAGRVTKPKTTAPAKRSSKAAGPNVKTVKKPRSKAAELVDKVADTVDEVIAEVTAKEKAKTTESTDPRRLSARKKM